VAISDSAHLHEEISPEDFAQGLNALLRNISFFKTGRLPSTLDELENMGIDSSSTARPAGTP
jgi:hypothetical protein